MKLKVAQKREQWQCRAIVQPGEYLIDRWDGKQCEMTRPLFRCEECGLLYCDKHYHPHIDKCAPPF